MDYKQTIQAKLEIEQAKKQASTKAELHSLEAQFNPQRPHTPPAPAQYQAIAEECLRGFRDVDRGDGKPPISFKDAQYFTNDPSEAAFLARQQGVTVVDHKKEGQFKPKSFLIGDVPWHNKEKQAP